MSNTESNSGSTAGSGTGPETESSSETASKIEIFEANLDLTLHSQAVLDLINAYSADPMGDGTPLSPEIQKGIISGLSQHPSIIIFLAFKDLRAVGIVSCFKGFSTFQAKPQMHIDDFFLQPEFRGQNIAKQLLASVNKKARELKCCRITSTIAQNNTHAKGVYTSAGFTQDGVGTTAGPTFVFFKTPVRRIRLDCESEAIHNLNRLLDKPGYSIYRK